MRRTLVLLVLLATVRGAAAADLADDRRAMMSLSWNLLKDARFGQDTREHAAFLVRRGDGTLVLVAWPYGAEPMRARYEGAIPAGTVAILHTHPNAYPLPSTGDTELARRLGLPVYVVTRGEVALTNGSRSQHVATGDWNPAR